MGTSEQAWWRLATVATDIRQVRAAEHRLDLSTRPRDLLHHPCMDLPHRRPGHDPLADTRMIFDAIAVQEDNLYRSLLSAKYRLLSTMPIKLLKITLLQVLRFKNYYFSKKRHRNISFNY
jgi:hypothetical protein